MSEPSKVHRGSLPGSAGIADAARGARRLQWTERARPLLLAAVIVATTVLAYLPCLGNGFIWDDDFYVTGNPHLRSWGGLAAIWTQPAASPQYYPLVFTTFWIEHHLWGLHPLGYHLVNVLLHAASAVVLWRLLRHLGVTGAFLAGLVFALHPVHVESVAWITERKNVLSGLLYLLAVRAYLRFDRLIAPSRAEGRFDPPGGGRRQWRSYAWAAALFVGALLSKTVTCTLPAALGLLLWWKRPRLSLRDLWPLVPFLLVGAAMGLTTAWLEKVHVRAEGEDWAFSIPQRLLIAGQALWFYAAKLIYPHPLTFIYPRWRIEQAAPWQYVFPLSAAAGMVALVLLRRRIGKGAAAGVLFFAGTLFPALGFVDVYPMRFSFVADHFQYLASIGLIALACSLLGRLGRGLVRRGGVGRATAAVGAVALLAALGTVTWRQTRIYRNAESVWQDTLTKNFDCWVAHDNLGEIYLAGAGSIQDPSARPYLERAVYHFSHVARLRPDFPEAFASLASAYMTLGRHSDAIDLFRHALSLKPKFSIPDFQARLHHRLGLSLAACGQEDEAIVQWREAMHLAPKMVGPYNNLGVVLMRRGQLQEAEDLYRQALALRPDVPQVHENLALVLEAKGDLVGAAESYRAVLAISPTNGQIHRRLAFVLAKLGMLQPALAAFNESVRLIGPDDAAAAALSQILKETAGVETVRPTQ
jgi:tetratricopeptide (TPR) repeat protein